MSSQRWRQSRTDIPGASPTLCSVLATPAHSCLAPVPIFQDPGGKGCGTTSNLPRLTRIPRTEDQPSFSWSRQGGSFR